MNDQLQAAEKKLRILEELTALLREQNEDLSTEFQRMREQNQSLDTENRGWLEIYQRQLSAIGDLKAEISRLESQIQASQAKP